MSMMVQCIWRQMFPCLGLEDKLLLVHFTTEDLLTIIPRARMCSESIAHDAEGSRANFFYSSKIPLFSKIQLVVYHQCCVLIG